MRISRYFRSMIGGGGVMCMAIISLLDWTGRIDTFLSHLNSPDKTWVDRIFALILHPPGWSILGTIILGLALIWWDVRRFLARRHPGPSAAVLTQPALMPDFTIRDLFFYVRPDLPGDPNDAAVTNVGKDIIDRFSTGQMKVWGRRIAEAKRLPLALIPSDVWQHGATFTNWFLKGHDGGSLDVYCHRPEKGAADWQYADLRVNRMEAAAIYGISRVGSAVQGTSPPTIEIHHEPTAPYEVVDDRNGRFLSTVRMGISNRGGRPLSNCKVYIEEISPEPALPGGLPILLDGAGFTLRHDDPEKLVDIAGQWNHVEQFRFCAPVGGAFFAEAMGYIDSKEPRAVVVKVVATECRRNAAFSLWVDDAKIMHLKFIRYVD